MLAYRVEEPEGSLIVRPVRLDSKATYRIVNPFAGEEEEKRNGADLMATGMVIELETHDSAIRHLIPV